MASKSTTVICQLVKDYFLEKEDKLLNGGDEIFSNMLQAVRCCNDQYLMSLFKELPENKQFQLGKEEVHDVKTNIWPYLREHLYPICSIETHFLNITRVTQRETETQSLSSDLNLH